MDQADTRSNVYFALEDATVCGTGFIKHVIKDDPSRTGGFTVGDKYVRFEDVYVYPDRGVERRHQNWFERYALPYWDMKKRAEAGEFDAEAVAQCENGYGVSALGIDDDPVYAAAFSSAVDSGNRYHEVWQGYCRWDGNWYVVEYHRIKRIFLAAYPYEWSQFFDYAPYQPFHIKPKPGCVYGQSIPDVLASLQEVNDTLINSELAYAQFAMQPLIFVRRNSTVHTMLEKNGYVPGGIVPFDGELKESVDVQRFQSNPFNRQTADWINQMADSATFNDMTIPGNIQPGDRTATEAQIIQSIAQLKLKRYLMNVRDCLKRFAKDKWTLVYVYVVVPQGIHEAYNGSDVSRVATQDVVIEWPNPETGQVERVEIPGAMRDDIQWEVTGNETMPGAQARLQQTIQMLGQWPIFQQAKQEAGLWELCRMYLRRSGMHSWAKVIGATPPPPINPLMQILQQLGGAGAGAGQPKKG
jgi:hypothetical protein